MKCKSCKFWKYKGFQMGICSGLSGEPKVVPLPDITDKKGNVQKRGRLLQVRSGVTGLTNPVITPEDFHCKNWSRKDG